jgi:hypothetical protein
MTGADSSLRARSNAGSRVRSPTARFAMPRRFSAAERTPVLARDRVAQDLVRAGELAVTLLVDRAREGGAAHRPGVALAR